MSSPDVIFHNGRIYPTVDPRHVVQALSVRKGRIVHVGSDREILGIRSSSIKKIDLHGHAVIPGLSDSHIHLLGYGMLLRTLDLSKTRSLAEIRRAVSSASKKKPRNGWILGRGWDQERLREHRYPNRDDLSLVSQPVFLRRICGHVAVANSVALSRAGISKTTPNPPGGLIERSPTTGEPTGVLKENAVGLVQSMIPQSGAEVEQALTYAARKLLRLGLTSLHCIVENVLELTTLRRLKNRGLILQSIYAIIPLGVLDRAVEEGVSTETRPGGFRIGGVKVFLDGSLGARTAALIEPYHDGPSAGMLTMQMSELEGVAEKAAGSGFQLSVHAIGDRAVEHAITAIERTRRIKESTKLRHRIEHSSLTPPELVSRLRKDRIVASVQPTFISSDTWAEKRLGRRRLSYLYPFHSMLQAGIPLAAGSDCPVEDPNPFLGVWSAVARPGLAASERLTVSQALSCYTIGSAYASFSEKYHGTLEPDKAADMAVLDRDPFKCPVDSLRRVKILQTIIGGRSTFA